MPRRRCGTAMQRRWRNKESSSYYSDNITFPWLCNIQTNICTHASITARVPSATTDWIILLGTKLRTNDASPTARTATGKLAIERIATTIRVEFARLLIRSTCTKMLDALALTCSNALIGSCHSCACADGIEVGCAKGWLLCANSGPMAVPNLEMAKEPVAAVIIGRARASFCAITAMSNASSRGTGITWRCKVLVSA